MAETTTELEILKIFLNISNYQNWPEEPEIGQLLSIALLTEKKKNALLKNGNIYESQSHAEWRSQTEKNMYFMILFT